MNNNNLQPLIEQFMRITNTFNNMHSDFICLNESIPLALGEIHLIECIGKHKEANVTELAKILGNTKGAVSQMARKLEKKGMIIKTKKVDNNKEIILALTAEGEKVFKDHEKLHADLYKDVSDSMNQSSKENISFMKELLDIVEKHITEYEKKYH